MNPQQNKALACSFFSFFSASDLARALACMTDDATWWIAGNNDKLRTAGLYSKERIAQLFESMLKQLSGGLRMTVTNLVAEHNFVAIEATSLGQLINGRTYSQQYHFLMEFRDSKICAVREYLDTQHVYDTWIAPL